MNSLTYKEYLSIALILAIIAVLGIVWQKPWDVGASNFMGNDYNSTSTKNLLGTTLTDRTLKVGYGTLAQVTITGAAAGVVNLCDATTTNISLRVSTMATSSLNCWNFPASTAANTYQFDAEFYYGLVIDTESTAPTTTVMWR